MPRFVITIISELCQQVFLLLQLQLQHPILGLKLAAFCNWQWYLKC